MDRVLDLSEYDYQCVVDMLTRLGNQLNKPNYRFLKGDVIAYAIEKATDGRLRYEDATGYDSIDQITGLKYEIKSVTKAFSKTNQISGKINLCNTYKTRNPKFTKTFDYLLCVQSDPKTFSIAEFDWETCNNNKYFMDGQFNLNRKLLVQKWICKDKTIVNNIAEVRLDIRKMLENLL